MFKQTQFLIFQKSFQGIKSNLGAQITLTLIAFLVLLSVSTLKKYSNEDLIKSSSDDLIENHLSLNITFTLSFPKKIQEYGRWFKGINSNVISIENKFKECNNEDYETYFPDVLRDSNKVYYCIKLEDFYDINNFFLVNCETINNNFFYRRVKDPSCNKTYNNYTALAKTMYDINSSSYNLYYTSFNVKNNNYTYHNLSLSHDGKDELKIYSLLVNTNKIKIDRNIFFNNVENKFSTKIIVKSIHKKQDSKLNHLFELYIEPDEVKKTIYFTLLSI